MAEVELEAQKREVLGKKLKKVRQSGLIPAVVYGRKFKSLPVMVERKAFEKKILASGAGKNAIISLKMAGAKAIPVLTNEVQRDPLTDAILHIDFSHLIMDELIKTKVPIELTGLPIGVKESGGVLIHGLREVEVECLPKDIPDKFTIDVADLKIGDSLHVSDLAKEAKVKFLTTAGEMIASCSAPTKEEEVAPAPTPEEVAAAGVAPVAGAEGAPAVDEKGKPVPAAKAAPGAAPAAKTAPAGKPEKPAK
ncbi:MAG TPA: 50S ribosomal protein L25 [Candidatus Sulfotelmatobacter sp.]|nr:50S ribosomal protein L25 [Candidatus Sulfotelmatobacter sp.]